MTSAPSSLKFFGQQFRQYIWIVLVCLYLCITYILEFSMAQREIYFFNGDDRLGPQNGTMFSITVILAVLCAVQGYAMLFSEKKTAFYLGMPITRKNLFWNNYLCGFVAAVVPCTISRIVCYFFRSDTAERPGYLLLMGIVVNIAGFLFIYHLVIIIILLTGRLIAAVIGTVLLAIYGDILIGYSVEKYSQVFFETYYRSNILDGVKMYLTPGSLYEAVTGKNEFGAYEEWIFSDKAVYFTVLLILVVLTLAAAYLLFKFRPAESAGKTLAFRRSKGMIKAFIAIPFSLLCGYFVQKMAVGGTSLPLLMLGVILGAFLINGTLEVLYQSDIRGVLSHKRTAVFVAAIGICIAISFYFDLAKYDSYCPDPDEIHSLALSVESVERKEADENLPLDFMNLTGGDKTRALDWLKSIQNNKAKKPLAYVTAAYKKSDTDIIYRKYQVSDEKQLDKFAPVYQNKEYKRATIPLAMEEKAGRQFFTWSNGAETYRLSYGEEENQQLLDCFHEDLSELEFEEIKETAPISYLRLGDWSGGSGRMGYIYPSFHRTIDFLKQRGIPADKALNDYDIVRIEVTPKKEEGQAEADKPFSVTKEEEIEEMKQELIYEPLAISDICISKKTWDVKVECYDKKSKTFEIVDCWIRD